MATQKKEEHGLAPSGTRPATFIHDPTTDDPAKMRQVGPQKVDLDDFDEGSYHKNSEPEDAEDYQLKVVEDDPNGNTHHLKNQDHYWSGTKAQFKEQFEK